MQAWVVRMVWLIDHSVTGESDILMMVPGILASAAVLAVLAVCLASYLSKSTAELLRPNGAPEHV